MKVAESVKNKIADKTAGKTVAGGLVDSLVQEVTEDELTDQVLPDKMVSVLNSEVLIPSGNHELNICRRDMFKADLDEDFKTICSTKQTVGSELFGDDLTEGLKVVWSGRVTRHQYGLQAITRKRTQDLTNMEGRTTYPGKGAAITGAVPTPASRQKQPSLTQPTQSDSDQEGRSSKDHLMPDQTHVSGVSYETESLSVIHLKHLNFFAGSTRTRMFNWRQITSDKNILTAVSGLKIEFGSVLPVQFGTPRPKTRLNYRLLV